MQPEIPFNHRSGFVAILGRPNVGKSSLVNALMGQKIAAVTSKAQTTRRRQLGILTGPDYQIVFTDTPGIHEERNKLGALMNQDARKSLEDADIAFLILDASQLPSDEDRRLIASLAQEKLSAPIWLGFNQMDNADPAAVNQLEALVREQLPDARTFSLSALTGQGLEDLKSALIAALPESPPFYDPDQITDLYERQIAADLIREAALNHLRDEVPHGIAVRIDEFLERGDKGARIEATLFVERESHKGIVVGQGGAMIKAIGTAARQEIERMSSRKVFLQLRVKVRKDWRNNESVLQRFGY